MTWLLCALARAATLTPMDRVQVDLVGDVVLEGRYLSSDPESLQLMVEGTPREVPMVLIQGALVNGEPVSLPVFQGMLPPVIEPETIARGPAPGVVVVSSMLFAGSGHAMLGDQKGFGGRAVVQTVMLGAEAYAAFHQKNAPLLFSVAALDLAFRGFSASDAHSIARRRRRRGH